MQLRKVCDENENKIADRHCDSSSISCFYLMRSRISHTGRQGLLVQVPFSWHPRKNQEQKAVWVVLLTAVETVRRVEQTNLPVWI
jgi:hypothetical protein